MFTTRQQGIIDVFFEDPTKARSVADFSNIGRGRVTIYRDLKELVDAEMLIPEGRSYRLNNKSDAYLEWDLSRPPHQRPTVRYNPDLLESYRPNESFLLTDEQMMAMEKTGLVSGVNEAQALGKPYERVLASLLIDLVHASSNLENVNISWLDTKTLIEFGELPKGLSETQLRIVLNHKDAISYLKEHGRDLSVGKTDLMNIHSLLIKGLLGDESAVGSLRSVVVKFNDSKYMPPDNPHQLREIFDLFCEKVGAISNPHEQSFFTMAFIPYMQPFQDGNKRTSRIAMNIPLVKNGMAPFSFSDMGKRDYMFGLLAFYERGRHNFLANRFANAYEKSAKRYAELIDHINEGGSLNTVLVSPEPLESPNEGAGSLPKRSAKRTPGLSR
jgi:Fic family protein